MKPIALRVLPASFVLALAAAVSAAAQPEPGKPAPAKPEPTAPAAKAPPAKDAEPAKPKAVGDPYPLATCPISGGKLGSMGEPVVKSYDGREVRFCCAACPPKFEKNQAKSLAALDEVMVKDQLPLYPTDTSVVSGRKLPDKPLDWIFNNRLIRSADEREKAEFLKDPAKHLAALDKAAIEKQAKDYPLKTCPVSKEPLGSMGAPKDLILAGRLIRLCCSSCEKDVRKEPSKYIEMIDAARKTPAEKKDGKQPADAGHDHRH